MKVARVPTGLSLTRPSDLVLLPFQMDFSGISCRAMDYWAYLSIIYNGNRVGCRVCTDGYKAHWSLLLAVYTQLTGNRVQGHRHSRRPRHRTHWERTNAAADRSLQPCQTIDCLYIWVAMIIPSPHLQPPLQTHCVQTYTSRLPQGAVQIEY